MPNIWWFQLLKCLILEYAELSLGFLYWWFVFHFHVLICPFLCVQSVEMKRSLCHLLLTSLFVCSPEKIRILWHKHISSSSWLSVFRPQTETVCAVSICPWVSLSISFFVLSSNVEASLLEVSGQLITLWLCSNFHTDDCFTSNSSLEARPRLSLTLVQWLASACCLLCDNRWENTRLL